MRIIDSKIDIGKSFQKLLANLDESYKMVESGKTEDYAYALGWLRGAVKVHVAECTEKGNVPAADPDDIKTVNI